VRGFHGAPFARATPVPMTARPRLAMTVFRSAKVHVHQSRDHHHVGDPLHRLDQHAVRVAEHLQERRVLLGQVQEPFVGDHDERIDVLLELDDPLLGLALLHLSLVLEGLGDHRHRERPPLAGDLCDDRRAAGPRSAAHAAVTNTMSAPAKAALILSASSSAAFLPISGLDPAPMPPVIESPGAP